MKQNESYRSFELHQRLVDCIQKVYLPNLNMNLSLEVDLLTTGSTSESDELSSDELSSDELPSLLIFGFSPQSTTLEVDSIWTSVVVRCLVIKAGAEGFWDGVCFGCFFLPLGTGACFGRFFFGPARTSVFCLFLFLASRGLADLTLRLRFPSPVDVLLFFKKRL